MKWLIMQIVPLKCTGITVKCNQLSAWLKGKFNDLVTTMICITSFHCSYFKIEKYMWLLPKLMRNFKKLSIYNIVAFIKLVASSTKKLIS